LTFGHTDVGLMFVVQVGLHSCKKTIGVDLLNEQRQMMGWTANNDYGVKVMLV